MSEPITLLLTADQIKQRVTELGVAISKDYEGREPVMIGVLKGSLVFMADLARAITVPVSIDFMSISSYGDGSNSGVVRILKDLDEPITGRHVILVEDIIDTGLTLTYVVNTLKARGPASLEICGLLNRDARRIIEVPVRYNGFDIPDRFVIGYGLDHDGRFRNLSHLLGVSEMDALRDPDVVETVLAQLP